MSVYRLQPYFPSKKVIVAGSAGADFDSGFAGVVLSLMIKAAAEFSSMSPLNSATLAAIASGSASIRVAISAFILSAFWLSVSLSFVACFSRRVAFFAFIMSQKADL